MTMLQPTHDPDADPYTDPATGVLRNLLGARTEAELAQREANLTAAALYRLDLNPVAGHYDLAHLQAIHAAIFGDIYHWAGQLRTIGIAKNEAFCPSPLIESQATEIFGRLAAEDHLRGLDLDPFTDRLSGYYAVLNHLHPFREGNGKAQRAFFTHLARDAGYEIRWERLDPHANINACRQTLYGDREPLRILFTDLVHPHRPVYDTPANTAANLHRRADDAHATAANLAGLAHRWFQMGQAGPNQQRIEQLRNEADTLIQAINRARDARAAYQAGLSELTQQEAEQRRLLAPLNAADHRDRPTTRGQERTRLQRQLNDLDAALHTLRQDLLDHAARAGQTSAEAPPSDTWDAYEHHARDLTANWHRYIPDARHLDRVLAVSQRHLSDWLTNYADELTGFAAAIQAGQITPEQAEVPLAALVPQPATQAQAAPQVAARPAVSQL